MQHRYTPYSVLDLSPNVEAGSARDASRNTFALALHAEGWGYNRYWLAEPPNMTGIARPAPSPLIRSSPPGSTSSHFL